MPTVPRRSQPNLVSAVAARWGGHRCGLWFDHSTRVCSLGLAVPTSDCTGWSTGRSQVPAGRDRAAVRRRLALRRPARLFQPLPQGPRWVRPWQRPAVPVGFTTAALAVAVPTNPRPQQHGTARHGTHSRCRTARHGNKFRAIDSGVRSGGRAQVRASEKATVRSRHAKLVRRRACVSASRACVSASECVRECVGVRA